MLNTSYNECEFLDGHKEYCTIRYLCLGDDCPLMRISTYVNKHTEILHNLATEMEKSMQSMLELNDVVREINTDMGKIIDDIYLTSKKVQDDTTP